VLARRRQPHDLDRLFHPPHAALRLDSHRLELVLECAAARLGLPLACDEYGASVRHEVEARPLIGEDERVAQRRAGEACGAETHALRAGGERAQQHDRVQAGLGEDRIANPYRVPAGGFRPLGHCKHLVDGGGADNHAAIWQRESETSSRISHTAPPLSELT